MSGAGDPTGGFQEKVCEDVSEAIGGTPMVRLRRSLGTARSGTCVFAKLEYLNPTGQREGPRGAVPGGPCARLGNALAGRRGDRGFVGQHGNGAGDDGDEPGSALPRRGAPSDQPGKARLPARPGR